MKKHFLFLLAGALFSSCTTHQLVVNRTNAAIPTLQSGDSLSIYLPHVAILRPDSGDVAKNAKLLSSETMQKNPLILRSTTIPVLVAL